MKRLIFFAITFFAFSSFAQEGVTLKRIFCYYGGSYKTQAATQIVFGLRKIKHHGGWSSGKTLGIVDNGYAICSSIGGSTAIQKECEADAENAAKPEEFQELIKQHDRSAWLFAMQRISLDTGNIEADRKDCIKRIKKLL